MAPEPEQLSQIHTSPSRQLSQPSFFSNTESKPRNRLTTREKKDLDREHYRLRDFEKKESMKMSSPVVQFARSENKKTHNNLLKDPKFAKKFNYNSQPEDDDDTESEASVSWEDDQSQDMEKSKIQEMVRKKRIDSNPFLKMIVTNVDKAHKYNPMRQDRPVFKFHGAGALGSVGKNR